MSGQRDDGGDAELIRMIRSSLRHGDPLDLLMLVGALLGAASAAGRHPLQGRREGPTLDDLVESFIGANFAETTACLAVMRALVDDHGMVGKIDAELLRRRRPLPAWITGLREARVSQEVRIFTDIQGDGDDYLIEVTLASGDVLTALVHVDHNLGTVVKDAFLVPEPVSTVVQRLMEMTDDEGTALLRADPAEARAIITRAIELGAMTYPPLESDTWPACRPLVEWLLRGLPDGGAVPELREWSADELEEIAAEFFASGFGKGRDNPDARGLLESILWFASGYSGTDPFRWSPVRVEILLTDWFPRKVVADQPFLAAMPDLLRAYIRFCDDRQGMFSARTAATLAAVDEWEPEYQQLIRAERLQGAHALAARLVPGFGDVDDWARDYAFDMLGLLERRVGGRVPLINLDAAPLPDEPFLWEGIPMDVRPVVEAMLADCDRVADEVQDLEFRTAMRRLLGRVAAGDPALLRRRASPTRGAAAVAWIIHRANHESFGPELLVQDLLAKFGVHGSVSQRAEPMLRAIGVDPSQRYIWINVAAGDLLTSKTRAAIIRMRDRNLKSLEVDVDSE